MTVTPAMRESAPGKSACRLAGRFRVGHRCWGTWLAGGAVGAALLGCTPPPAKALPEPEYEMPALPPFAAAAETTEPEQVEPGEAGPAGEPGPDSVPRDSVPPGSSPAGGAGLEGQPSVEPPAEGGKEPRPEEATAADPPAGSAPRLGE